MNLFYPQGGVRLHEHAMNLHQRKYSIVHLGARELTDAVASTRQTKTQTKTNYITVMLCDDAS